MHQTATDAVCFPTHPRSLEARFDLDLLLSDGGPPWLVETDDELGLTTALATAIPDWRRGPVRDSLAALVRHRVLQIACGYPNQNDATTRSSSSAADGCPAAVSRSRACRHCPGSTMPATRRVARRRPRCCWRPICSGENETGSPERILLDLDSTADPMHGDQ